MFIANEANYQIWEKQQQQSQQQCLLKDQKYLQFKYQEQQQQQHQHPQQHQPQPQHFYASSFDSYSVTQNLNISPMPFQMKNLPSQHNHHLHHHSSSSINSHRPFSYHKPSQSSSHQHQGQFHIAPPSKDIRGVSTLSRLQQPSWKKIGGSRDTACNGSNSARDSSGCQSVSPVKSIPKDIININKGSYFNKSNNNCISIQCSSFKDNNNNNAKNYQCAQNPILRNHQYLAQQSFPHHDYHPSSCDPFETMNPLKNISNNNIKHQYSYDQMCTKNISKDYPSQQQQQHLPWQQRSSPSTATVSPDLNPSQPGNNSMLSSAGLISHNTDTKGVVEWTIDQVEEYQRNSETKHPQRIYENEIPAAQSNFNNNNNNLYLIKDSLEQRNNSTPTYHNKTNNNNNNTGKCLTFGQDQNMLEQMSVPPQQLPISRIGGCILLPPRASAAAATMPNHQDQTHLPSSPSSPPLLHYLNNCNIPANNNHHNRYHSTNEQFQSLQPAKSLPLHSNTEFFHQIPQLFPNSSVKPVSSQTNQYVDLQQQQQIQEQQQQQSHKYPSSSSARNSSAKPSIPLENTHGFLALNYNISTDSTQTNTLFQCYTARETSTSKINHNNNNNTNTPSNSSPFNQSNHHRTKLTPPVKHTMPQQLFNTCKLQMNNLNSSRSSNPSTDKPEISQGVSQLANNNIVDNSLKVCLLSPIKEIPKLSTEIGQHCVDRNTNEEVEDHAKNEYVQDNPQKARRRSPLRNQVFNGSNSKQPQQIDLRLHRCLEQEQDTDNPKPQQSTISTQIQQQQQGCQSGLSTINSNIFLPTQIKTSMLNTTDKQSVPSLCEIDYWNMIHKHNHTHKDFECLSDLKELQQQPTPQQFNTNIDANKPCSQKVAINACNSHGRILPQDNTNISRISIPPSAKFSEYSNKDYHFIRRLGQGKYSEVFLAQDKQTGFLFAVKQVEKALIIELSMEDQFSAELKIHMALNHPNILRLYGFTADEHFFYLFMEYAPDGEVLKLLKESHERTFSEAQAGYYLSQLASALAYLHSKKIIHRDLKPDNLLISNGILKLGDFGYSRYCDGLSTRDTFCGTLDYLSPQVVKGEQYNQSTDVWSFGVIAYEMMQGIAPFYENTKEATMEKIESGVVRFDERICCEGKQFIQELLAMKGEQRKTMKQVCLDRWLVEKVKEYEQQSNERITVL